MFYISIHLIILSDKLHNSHCVTLSLWHSTFYHQVMEEIFQKDDGDSERKFNWDENWFLKVFQGILEREIIGWESKWARTNSTNEWQNLKTFAFCCIFYWKYNFIFSIKLWFSNFVLSLLARIFHCPCVGLIPLVGLRLTWSLWVEDSHYTLQSNN